MAAVGGMFAVAGLPAYAMSDFDAANAELVSATTAQSLVVSDVASASATDRDSFGATSVEQLNDLRRNAQLASANSAYMASGAQQLGDDYPWAIEGYGLSPLNYYYRQCTDFVAWRLNRDAGTTSAPFAFVWSNLTPGGGDASQWKWAWENKGWTVSSTPVVGSVAWFNGNHVAYVKSVLPGNQVLIEEYNYNYRVYGQRTLAWGDVAAFLYPPGR
jgi:peptidoglycan DL-endopeptidase CwlO